MNEFWRKLRARRRELELTQKEVADYCGVSQTAVNQWESQKPDRKAFPKQDKLQKLSEILKVDINWFYSEKQIESPIIASIAEMDEESFEKAKASVEARQMGKLWSKLRSRRRELNLTQTEVANYCGVTTGAVGRWEAKEAEVRTYPRRDKLEKLSEVLQLKGSWFLDRNDDLASFNVDPNTNHTNTTEQDSSFLEEQMSVIHDFTTLITEKKLTREDLAILKALSEQIKNRY
ncbi:helix-turn-helix domain-containing protein [Zooshikella ganghwensis]|uniref:helix-turn-helix domain-containing protein n=1 Tax=Zooshikella ganghwensis TaxID=202772 RepID=UPI000412EEA3|nr:helix-turn-helix transcriptional regulator [Zooshikella ganghwensis]